MHIPKPLSANNTYTDVASIDLIYVCFVFDVDTRSSKLASVDIAVGLITTWPGVVHVGDVDRSYRMPAAKLALGSADTREQQNWLIFSLFFV